MVFVRIWHFDELELETEFNTVDEAQEWAESKACEYHEPSYTIEVQNSTASVLEELRLGYE